MGTVTGWRVEANGTFVDAVTPEQRDHFVAIARQMGFVPRVFAWHDDVQAWEPAGEAGA